MINFIRSLFKECPPVCELSAIKHGIDVLVKIENLRAKQEQLVFDEYKITNPELILRHEPKCEEGLRVQVRRFVQCYTIVRNSKIGRVFSYDSNKIDINKELLHLMIKEGILEIDRIKEENNVY